MLLNISVIIVFIYTALCIADVQMNRHVLANMTGNVSAMTIGLNSNLILGVLLGMIFKDDLVLSTGLSIVFCFIIGYLVGRPIHMLAVLEGVGGGVMGGLHGAMLGEMIPSARWDTMLLIMDTLFIALSALVIYLIYAEKNKEENAAVQTAAKGRPEKSRRRWSFWMVYVILPVIVVCAAAVFSHSSPGDELPEPERHIHSA